MGRRAHTEPQAAPLAPGTYPGAGGAPEGATPPLTGMPIACVDLTGKVADVTLMGPLCLMGGRAAGIFDALGGEHAQERARSWRACSDAAQVIANYLRCHPAVFEVRYPGLTSDPSYALASRTLQGGFGPWVDYRLHLDLRWVRVEATAEDAAEQIMRLECALAPYVEEALS